MATLPQSGMSLAHGVVFQQQPSLTWYIDRQTKRIAGTAEGLRAVKQAVDAILNVERFRHPIFSPYSGMQWEGLIGQDPGYVAAELQRRITEALMMDDRVKGLSQFTYAIRGDVLTAALVVDTVYGDIETTLEVHIT